MARFLRFFPQVKLRKIATKEIEALAKDLIFKANFQLQDRFCRQLEDFQAAESSPLAKNALGQMCQNFAIAKRERLPLCQDTGTAHFFARIGHRVLLEKPLQEICNDCVGKFYREFDLRKSTVSDPLVRENLGRNLPAFLHLQQVAGESLHLTFLAKGGGAENKSRLKMLPPSAGEQGVIDFAVQTVQRAGGAACPPFQVGIGVGGTFDTVGTLAKKAILQSQENGDPKLRKLEAAIFKKLQKLNLGAMGLGGSEFLLGVRLCAQPCHIASLPVAVNLQCHSARWASGLL